MTWFAHEHQVPDATKAEISTSWALFILIMLLISALFGSYLLQTRKVQAVHETVMSIFAGTWIRNETNRQTLSILRWELSSQEEDYHGHEGLWNHRYSEDSYGNTKDGLEAPGAKYASNLIVPSYSYRANL